MTLWELHEALLRVYAIDLMFTPVPPHRLAALIAALPTKDKP